MDDKERRSNLGEFLQIRRKRLKPEDVGLPQGKRRRTPGLRREEVAQLANISASWYTSLEQGRDIQTSEEVLENLVTALQLNPAERQHLFLLAKPSFDIGAPKEKISPALFCWVQTLSQPAYVLGRRWDLLVWNNHANKVFQFSDDLPPHSNNYLWRFFQNPRLKNSPSWTVAAKQVIAQFRADSARYPGDPWFKEIIYDLLETSNTFREGWDQYDIRGAFEGQKTLHHPTLGVLEFEQITLQLPTNPDIKVVILTDPHSLNK
jgi:transcriptional regulator with XRE-family HTH domain